MDWSEEGGVGGAGGGGGGGGGNTQQKREGDGEGREGGVRVLLRGRSKETERETNWKNKRGTSALLLFQPW